MPLPPAAHADDDGQDGLHDPPCNPMLAGALVVTAADLGVLACQVRLDRLVGVELVIVPHFIDEKRRNHCRDKERQRGYGDKRKVEVPDDPYDHPYQAGKAERHHDYAEPRHSLCPRRQRVLHFARVLLDQGVDADAEQVAQDEQALHIGIGAATL